MDAVVLATRVTTVFFYLVGKYPMIISTPRNPYRENAQSPNRSTGTCAPEFTVVMWLVVIKNIGVILSSVPTHQYCIILVRRLKKSSCNNRGTRVRQPVANSC